MSDQVALDKFCDYLRIKTVQPHPDYESCRKFLEAVPFDNFFILIVGKVRRGVESCVKGKPIILMTWKGKEESLPSLLLNSHTDVVPVSQDHWDHDPFSGTIDSDGKIISRGAQDMKCVGIGYLEAIRHLKSEGFTPNRTIHLSFVPDEEIGGEDGMGLFIKTDTFQSLYVGVALDEGIPSPFDNFFIFNQERAPWWIQISAVGPAGHGSTLPQGTAMEKIFRFMKSVFEFRDEQVRQLVANGGRLGEVTSINITKVSAGVQTNVIPNEASMSIDVRVSPSLGESKFSEILDKWAQQANVTIQFEQKGHLELASSTEDSDPHWKALNGAITDMGYTFSIETFPGATDSRYLRSVGIPAYGISPFNKTPLLAHGHNEYLHKVTFLDGIKVYKNIISRLAQ